MTTLVSAYLLVAFVVFGAGLLFIGACVIEILRTFYDEWVSR